MCAHVKLPTVGIVIGWLSGFISLIQIAIYVVVLASHDKITEGVNYSYYPEEHGAAVITTGILAISSVLLAISLLDFIASGLVIIGTMRKSHLMLLPWLINNGLAVLFKFCIFNFFVAKNVNDFVEGAVIVSFVIFGINFGAWISLCCVFKSIRANRNYISLSITKSAIKQCLVK